MNNYLRMISVIPRLPPAIDGVGDYALNLARQLCKDFNIQTHFIVGNSQWNGAPELEGFPVTHVPNSSSKHLVELLSSDRISLVLLHYVGYGYAKRGCPVWLVDGLQNWKSLYPQKSLIIMFHEVFTSGTPPWTSSFWLSPLQKNLIFRLSQLSDSCITNNQNYADILIKLSNGKHPQISVLPVFSNIGEPRLLLPLSERSKQLILFGLVPQRIRAYQQCKETLVDVCQSLGIQEILDLGTPTGKTPPLIGNVPIIELGQQPSAKISDIMKNSIAGFLSYNPNFLGKSGVFAAYCAHRLIPINAKSNNSLANEIKEGENYWVPSKNSVKGIKMLQLIADNAHAWYSDHNLSIQSKKFFEIFQQLNLQ